MNERKLDINAPLMSVRRSSAASPSPSLTLAYYLDQVTEPVAVPFNWEHIPGRPKGNHGSQPQPSASKESPTNVAEEDDDDDVYSDALETLSCTESASMKCSASGVSGVDNFDAADDKQAQDFMMNRFLPAAKAMTVHPPQYASSRKQQFAVAEQPRDVLGLVREERKSIVNKHMTEEEEESDDDGYDEATSVSAKGCGVFPRLCVRSSFCLLNTVPNMSCAYEYGKPSKSSHTPIKKAWDAIHKSKSERFTYSAEMKQLGGSGRLSPFRRSRTTFQSKPSLQGIKTIENTFYIDNASATTLSRSLSCSVDTKNSKEDTILLASKENQEQEDKAHRLTTHQETNQDSMSFQLVRSSFDKETNSSKQIVAVDHHQFGADLVPAPLLPKSPSDSWLSRALPLVYMKNSGFPHSNSENKFVAKRESLNASSRFVKWETMVKTWNLHDGHANCSQELTVYKLQHSKS